MKRFVDLHLCPSSRDAKTTERMASLAAEMGFCLVGLTFDIRASRDERQTTTKMFEDQGLETVSRIDLHPRDRNELLMLLRKVRSSFDIVAVECHAKKVTPIAFRDRRVDLVFFSSGRPKLRASELTPRRTRRPVEFNIADLLKDDSTIESSLYRALSVIRDIQRKHLPMLVSSGATDWLLMRAPKDMAAVLSVLGLDTTQALDAVSRIPFSLAQENLEKQRPGFISDGIELVRPQL